MSLTSEVKCGVSAAAIGVKASFYNNHGTLKRSNKHLKRVIRHYTGIKMRNHVHYSLFRSFFQYTSEGGLRNELSGPFFGVFSYFILFDNYCFSKGLFMEIFFVGLLLCISCVLRSGHRTEPL